MNRLILTKMIDKLTKAGGLIHMEITGWNIRIKKDSFNKRCINQIIAGKYILDWIYPLRCF